MDYIKAFSFCLGWDENTNFSVVDTKKSIDTMVEETSVDSVVLVFAAEQDTPNSIEVRYKNEKIPHDDELKEIIRYMQDDKNLRVILKPTVNPINAWRGFISFFEKDVPCEPKWSEWFASYTEFQVHYAKIAEEMNCFMFCVGCEMVMSDHRAAEWREVVWNVRKHYSGLVTYNADKYQEDNVTWWDAVDVISASGYYPIDKFPENLERIKKVVELYRKPFFFIEAGIPARTGSSNVPNDWTWNGELNLAEQALYYQTMFEECDKFEFVQGWGLWSWDNILYPKDSGLTHDGYAVYGKPASKIIKDFFESK